MISIRKNPPPPAKPLRPLSIILAEDVDDIRRLIAGWLEADGHSVTSASNGREVIHLIRERPFDLVITDIVMPEADGWDAILAVNRLRPTTRVLAISGGGQQVPADVCLRVAKGVGADAVLLKPFDRDQFMTTVARVIGTGETGGAPAA